MVFALFDRHDETAFRAAIPAEQALVQNLEEQGRVEAQYFSLDRSKGWMIMHGDSQEQIKQILRSFPLSPYMHTELT